MITASRQHLREAGEGYFEHLRFAATVGSLAVGAGLACLLHALVPAACQRTCSRTIGQLQQLFADRNQLESVRNAAEGVLIFEALCFMTLAIGTWILIAGGSAAPAIILSTLTAGFPIAYLWSNPHLLSDEC